MTRGRRFTTLLAMLMTISMLRQAGARAQIPAVAGDWQFAQDIYGNTLYRRLTIAIDGTAVSGTIGRDTITGTAGSGRIHFTSRSGESSDEFDATLADDSLTGSLVHTQPDDPKTTRYSWTARRIPAPKPGPPVRHEFVPKTFHRVFSASIEPALHIWPGDTVHTTTVDAGGTDEKGVTRVLGGNPQTGPFFVETAMPGDVLAVTLNRVRLNRDWATSDDALMARAMDSALAVKMKDVGKGVRWKIDRERGVASPEVSEGKLRSFTIPLRPMLGCIAVAPGFAQAPMPTGDSGPFGGNMDFNEIVEGTTVYLPVGQPGALLFVGDGHAAQGDGELNGNALETSMEVEFTVNVVRSKPLASPRVESATHLMTVGLGGTLEDAMRRATSGMTQWLEQDYGLSPSEIAIVLGSATEVHDWRGRRPQRWCRRQASQGAARAAQTMSDQDRTRSVTEHIMTKIGAAVAVALLWTAAATAQALTSRGVTAEDYYAFETLSDPHFSPDGTTIAFVVTTVDQKQNRRRSEIRAVQSDGSRPPVVMTSTAQSSSSPRWSPDGKTLAFLSARPAADSSDAAAGRTQIWLMPLGGGEARRVTSVLNGVTSFQWSPDGSRFLVVSRSGLNDEAKSPSDVRHYAHSNYKFNDTGWFDDKRSHIWVVDVATGRATQITSGDDWNDTDPQWSPDGRRIAFVSDRTGRAFDEGHNTDVWVIDANGGPLTKISDHETGDGQPRWSPDGQTIAFVSSVPEKSHAKIWLASSSGGSASRLAAEALDVLPSALRWAENGKALYFETGFHGTSQIYRVDLGTKRAAAVTAGDRTYRYADISAPSTAPGQESFCTR